MRHGVVCKAYGRLITEINTLNCIFRITTENSSIFQKTPVKNKRKIG
jgi:hypothetical protein